MFERVQNAPLSCWTKRKEKSWPKFSVTLSHFTPLVSLYDPWKHGKTRAFLMFLGVVEREISCTKLELSINLFEIAATIYIYIYIYIFSWMNLWFILKLYLLLFDRINFEVSIGFRTGIKFMGVVPIFKYQFCWFELVSKAYSEPCQTSKMERFAKVFNEF